MAKKEYIERNGLVEDLELMAERQVGERQQGILGVCHTIRARKAADVEEVRHGKWVDDIFGRGDMVCSECEQYPATDEDGNPLPSLAYWQPYRCPNCGAVMDVDEEREG